MKKIISAAVMTRATVAVVPVVGDRTGDDTDPCGNGNVADHHG